MRSPDPFPAPCPEHPFHLVAPGSCPFTVNRLSSKENVSFSSVSPSCKPTEPRLIGPNLPLWVGGCLQAGGVRTEWNRRAPSWHPETFLLTWGTFPLTLDLGRGPDSKTELNLPHYRKPSKRFELECNVIG